MRTRVDCLPDHVYDDHDSPLLAAHEAWWASVADGGMDVQAFLPDADYTLLTHTTPLPPVPEIMQHLITELED